MMITLPACARCGSLPKINMSDSTPLQVSAYSVSCNGDDCRQETAWYVVSWEDREANINADEIAKNNAMHQWVLMNHQDKAMIELKAMSLMEVLDTARSRLCTINEDSTNGEFYRGVIEIATSQPVQEMTYMTAAKRGIKTSNRDQWIKGYNAAINDGMLLSPAQPVSEPSNSPVIPEQPVLVENLKNVMNNWLAMEPKLAFQPEFTDVMMLLDAEPAPAQLVSEPYKLPDNLDFDCEFENGDYDIDEEPWLRGRVDGFNEALQIIKRSLNAKHKPTVQESE